MLIGQSRGGALARSLAVREPENVAALVMLGSPVCDPLAVSPRVLRTVKADGQCWATWACARVFSTDCAEGDCCERFWEDLDAPLAEHMEAISIFSRSDGIVDWHACLDPHARNVEVSSSHCGMSVHPAVYRVLERCSSARPGGRMEWMSPIDSSFLHVENDVTPMHIGGVSLFEGPPPPFEDLKAMVAGKLDLVPRYRQKVRFVPLAAGSPVWVDDPHFSLDYHVRHTADPGPRRRGAAAPAWPGGSSPSTSTATSRCGSCGRSRAWPTGAGRCSRRSTTAWSTASPRPT